MWPVEYHPTLVLKKISNLVDPAKQNNQFPQRVFLWTKLH